MFALLTQVTLNVLYAPYPVVPPIAVFCNGLLCQAGTPLHHIHVSFLAAYLPEYPTHLSQGRAVSADRRDGLPHRLYARQALPQRAGRVLGGARPHGQYGVSLRDLGRLKGSSLEHFCS